MGIGARAGAGGVIEMGKCDVTPMADGAAAAGGSRV